MAKIVGGFCMPHDPLITGNPEFADPKQAANVMTAYADIRRRVEELDADTVIVIGDDHYVLFGPGCVPQMLIAIGELEGPLEPWLRIERGVVPNHPALAEHIMKTGFDKGFDWAVAKTMTLDHSTMVPIHLTLRGNPKVRVIPVYISSGVTPVIRAERAYAVGKLIREAVESWPGNERVVVYGTGGISHWVGSKEMGRVNQEFDHRVLSMVERGDIESLLAMDDEYILENGGNGALEIRNWICALGAMTPPGGRVTGKTLVYEPIPPWVTGIGLVELQSGGVG
jgi:protocatechuate 4,5-dioxygenase beta chain